MDWALFEQLDALRRMQGSALDAIGLGPAELPYREIHRQPGLTLRRYLGEGDETGPPVLIVPAPIKRSCIWDLAPDVSAVRRCREHGSRVYLADWRPAPPQLGLADYAGRLILACLDAARVERAVLLVGRNAGRWRRELQARVDQAVNLDWFDPDGATRPAAEAKTLIYARG